MRRLEIAPGARFGKLVVIGDGPKSSEGRRQMLCACDPGHPNVLVRAWCLMGGHTLSCGCMQKERAGAAKRTHGLTGTAEYRAWRRIKSVMRPNHPRFLAYGGRGITVSPEWEASFEAFFRDMGPRPSNRHSVERINNSVGYSASNCRWAVVAEQNRNKRSNLWVHFRGRRIVLTDACRLAGLDDNTVRAMRYRTGCTPQDAFDYYLAKHASSAAAG